MGKLIRIVLLNIASGILIASSMQVASQGLPEAELAYAPLGGAAEDSAVKFQFNGLVLEENPVSLLDDKLSSEPYLNEIELLFLDLKEAYRSEDVSKVLALWLDREHPAVLEKFEKHPLSEVATRFLSHDDFLLRLVVQYGKYRINYVEPKVENVEHRMVFTFVTTRQRGRQVFTNALADGDYFFAAIAPNLDRLNFVGRSKRYDKDE